MIFGWDVSTSIIGATVLKADGTFVASESCDLRKMSNIFDKAQAAKDFVADFTMKYSLPPVDDVHYVEDRLANFAFGRSMLQTLMLLGAFNMVVSWFCWEMSRNVIHIHPSTAKAIMKRFGLKIEKGDDKKLKTLQFVWNHEPMFPREYTKTGKPQPWMFDQADSYCIAKVGFHKFGCDGKSNSES